METVRELCNQLTDKRNYDALLEDRWSYTWAGVPAVLMMLHKVKTYNGYVFRASCWGFGTFALVSFVNFNVCQREEMQKLAVLKMNRMKHISEAPDSVKQSMMPRSAANDSSNTASNE